MCYLSVDTMTEMACRDGAISMATGENGCHARNGDNDSDNSEIDEG